jgi:DNA-binding response OmpR family regulator
MQHSQRLRIAEVEIDLQQHQVYLGGEPADFSATEFSVLALLAANSGRTFTREQILSGVHGNALVATPRAVDFQICCVRRKLGRLAAYLKTVRGVGYRFEPPVGPAS